MVEHRTLTAVVAGSNPVSLAKVNKHLTRRENLVIIAKDRALGRWGAKSI